MKFTYKNNIENLPNEFLHLADQNKQSAEILLQNELYNQAGYCLIQCIEMLVRAKIFTLVDPKNKYFQEKTRTHDVDELINFLIEIVATDAIKQQQVKQQLETYVLDNIKFNQLHNNLRYPFYSKKYNNYSKLEFNQNHVITILNKIETLKKFINDIEKLK